MIRGFKDAFWFDFRDEAVRDAYLVHPSTRRSGQRSSPKPSMGRTA